MNRGFLLAVAAGLSLVLSICATPRQLFAGQVNVYFDVGDGGRIFTISERNVVQAAAAWWEQTLPPSVTRNVLMKWKNLGDTTTPARTLQNGAPEYRIEFNTAVLFFIDPTPTVNEEYTLSSQSSFALQTVGIHPLASRVDLYSVSLQQLGHTLGFFGSFPGYITAIENQSGTDDDSPSANPPFITTNLGPVFLKGNGVFDPPADPDVALELISVSDVLHPGDLMNPLVPAGSRRVITPRDAAVLTRAMGWSLNIPSFPQATNGDWNTPATWTGGAVPDFNDSPIISPSIAVDVTTNVASVWSLSNNGTLNIASGRTVIFTGGTNNANTGLISILDNAELAINGIWSNAGSISLGGGTVSSFRVANSGSIAGVGTVSARLTGLSGGSFAAVGGSNSLLLAFGIDGTNAAQLSSAPGTTLAFKGNSTTPLSLITNAGTIEVRPGATLSLSGDLPLLGAYKVDGTLRITGHSIRDGAPITASAENPDGLIIIADGASLGISGAVTLTPQLQCLANSATSPAVTIAPGAGLTLSRGGNNADTIQLMPNSTLSTAGSATVSQPSGIIVGTGTLAALIDGSGATPHGPGGECQIIAEAGDITLASGTTITGCSLVSQDGSHFSVPSGQVTLHDAVVSNTPAIANVFVDTQLSGVNTTLRVVEALENNGVISLASGSSCCQSVLDSTSSASISGTGQIIFSGSTFNRISSRGGTLTLGPGQFVHGSGPTNNHQMTTDGGTLLNQGTIQADGSGAHLSLSGVLRNAPTGLIVADSKPLQVQTPSPTGVPTTLENLGTIRARNGQVVRILGSLSTLGTLDTWQGILEFGATYAGPLAATSATTGDIRLVGASITGGPLASTGANFVVREGINTLTNLTTSANVQVDAPLNGVNTTLRVVGTVENNGVISLVSGSSCCQSVLDSTSSASISGTGQIIFSGSTFNRISSRGGTLTLGPGQFVHGSGPANDHQLTTDGGTLVNQGTIQADGSGAHLGLSGVLRNDPTGIIVADSKSLRVQTPSPTGVPTTLENLGTIRARNGQVVRILGALSALGTLDTWQGILEFGASYTGPLTATAATTGDIRLVGASITGGPLASTGASFVVREGMNTLTNLTTSANVQVDAPLNGVNTTLRVVGAIENNGVISLVSGSSCCQSVLDSTSSATISGTGQIVFSGSTFNRISSRGGTLTLGPGQFVHGSGPANDHQLTTDGGTLLNQGTIQAGGSGAHLSLSGVVRNDPTGLIVADSKPLRVQTPSPTGVPTTFENLGTVRAQNGQSVTLDSSASLANYSNVTSRLTAGTWDVLANSSIILTGATITTNAANIRLSGSGSAFAAINGLASNEGMFSLLFGRSFNTVGPFTNSGVLTLGPSASPTLSVNGDYTQAATGTLEVQIGGTTNGAFGRLAINGAGVASVNGTIAATLTGGFNPSANDTFSILTAGSVVGTFTATNLPVLSGGKTWQVQYLPTSVHLIVVGPVLGDINGDGQADLNDLSHFLAVLIGNDTNPAHVAASDLNGDGVANGGDIQLFINILP